MVTRQYIGARYVPIIDKDPWDNTKAYDPQTVVMYQGNSYTSRTFVPVGVDISDTTYWALTGNYNAQVEMYRQEVAALSENVGNINELDIEANDIVEAVNKLTSDIINEFDVNTYYGAATSQSFTNYTQDAAIFNNYLFGMSADGVVKVKDITTNSDVATITLDGSIKPHGNVLCFGNKVNSDDAFPLLYITGYNGYYADDTPLEKGTCFVYKIYEDFSSELVQEIRIGFTDNTDMWTDPSIIGTGGIAYGNFVVDVNDNILYVFTPNTTHHSTRIFKFLLPTLSNTSVILNTQDIVEYFDIPFLQVPQGSKYLNDRLYILSGDNSGYNNSSYLSVIDMKNKCQITSRSLSDIMPEPEAIVLINGRIYVAGSGTYNRFYLIDDMTVYGNIGNISSVPSFKNKNVAELLKEIVENITPYSFKLDNDATNRAKVTFSGDGATAFIYARISYNKLTVSGVAITIRATGVVGKPTITITDDALVDVPSFTRMTAPTLRKPTDGSVSDVFSSDGGLVYHIVGRNTIIIQLYDYMGDNATGYLEIMI